MIKTCSRGAQAATLGAFVFLALTQASNAQSSMQLYGLVDLAAGQFQAAGAPKMKALASGSMATSYLGLRGTEDLGDGLSALVVLESYLRPDTGESGRFAGDAFWTRNSFVGLSGRVWTIAIGRNTTPLFVSTLQFNAFGPSIPFSPSMRQWLSGAAGVIIGDTGWNDSMRYDSPTIGGIRISLMGNLGEGKANAVGRNATAQALYGSGPFAATVVWQSVKNATAPLPVGMISQRTWQVGASYDFAAIKLFGQYGKVDLDAAARRTTKLSDVGVSVPVGLGRVLAAYGRASNSGAATYALSTASLGYDYHLSKRTDLYAVYMNERKTSVTPGNSYALGIRHSF